MAESEAQIIADIDGHVSKEGSGYSAWYVGVTEDIDKRLHGDHKVPKKNAWFIYRETSSDSVARRIEKHFLDLGMEGGGGGGDEDATHVYAYKMTEVTEP